jgi:hypothetical protein
MDSIAYINELMNYATCNMHTYELNVESDKLSTIKHNIFDGTMQTQEFRDFIWDLYFNFSEDEEQIEPYMIDDYIELFKEFKELCKTRNK